MASSDLKTLMKQKSDIESEIVALQDVLRSHKTNMNEALVDSEGFPRNDLDVMTIRKTRVRIIYLQNDLKNMMSKIEDGLHRLHADAREKKSSADNQMAVESPPIIADLEPFLCVDQVSEGSPAEKAGLEVNDLIIQFGSITFPNFEGLQTIGSIVKHSKGEEICVAVKRSNEKKTLKLIPNTWSGKGLLGCNVIPYKR